MANQCVCRCARVCLVLALLVCAACSREPREYEVYEADLLPTTKVLEEDTAADLLGAADNGTLLFDSASDYAAGLQVHDVVMVGVTQQTPYGFLGMVTAVASESGGIRVQTEPCGLEYAYRKLHLEVQRKVDLADCTFSRQLPGGRGFVRSARVSPADSGGDSFDISVDYYPFNGDGDTSTPEDQVHVVGNLGGSLYYFFGLDIDWGSLLTSWPPDGLPEVKVGFEVSAGLSTNLDAEGVVTKRFSKEEELDTIPLDPFAVGPVLWFFPEISLKAKVEGGSSGTFDLSLQESGSLECGVSFSSENGASYTPPQADYDFELPTVSVLNTAGISAGIGPRLHIRLYKTAGPYATIWAEAGLDADWDADPCWELSGGFSGDLGFDIRLWSLSLADWNTTFDIVDETLASGGCVDDPETPHEDIPDLMDPAFTPWALRLEDTVSSFEIADSYTIVNQVVDGRYIVSGDGVRVLAKIQDDGSVVWARQFVRDDAVLPVPLTISATADTPDAGIVAAVYEPHMLMKLDAGGQLVWARECTLSRLPADGFTALYQSPGGDLYLAGTVLEPGTYDTDVWIVKVDQDGELLWSKQWGLPARSEQPAGLVPVNDDLVLVGRSFSMAQDPATQSFVLSLTPAGDLSWAREVSGQGFYNDVLLRTALQSRDGDIIAGGTLRTTQPRALLMKIKVDGTFGWANASSGQFLGPDLTGFVQLSDGGYLGCGSWWTGGVDDVWLARMDSIGRFMWIKRFDDGFDNACPSILLTGGGGAMFAARTAAGTDRSSLWLMRLPVKTGDITFAPGSGAVVTDASYTEVTADITFAESAAAEFQDLIIDMENVTVTATQVSPHTVVLAP